MTMPVAKYIEVRCKFVDEAEYLSKTRAEDGSPLPWLFFEVWPVPQAITRPTGKFDEDGVEIRELAPEFHSAWWIKVEDAPLLADWSTDNVIVNPKHEQIKM